MSRLLAVAASDPAVATSFIRVTGMIDPLPALLRPAVAVRVYARSRRGTARPARP
jgi:hypothetical protein